MAVEIRSNRETVEAMYGTVTVRSPSYRVVVRTGILSDGIPYDGPYEVVPDADGEVLLTRTKTMRDDVTVHPIPYVLTQNEGGGYTASIAS